MFQEGFLRGEGPKLPLKKDFLHSIHARKMLIIANDFSRHEIIDKREVRNLLHCVTFSEKKRNY